MHNLEKKYPDTEKGAIQCLKDLSSYSLEGAKAFPDPQVQGVWKVATKKIKVVVYLAGYKATFGDIREMNDFEETK